MQYNSGGIFESAINDEPMTIEAKTIANVIRLLIFSCVLSMGARPL